MKKKFIFILLIIIFFLTPNNSTGFNKNILEGNLIIGVENKGEKFFIGSAVYVDSKIGEGILTAKHVAAALLEFEKVIVCDITKKNCYDIDNFFIANSNNELNSDWAFYKKKLPFKQIKISKSKVQLQEKITVIGNSWGYQPWISNGTVAWIDGSIIHLNGFCAPGCSGGGVFKKEKLVGLIIALHSSEFGPETSQLIAIPIDSIEIF